MKASERYALREVPHGALMLNLESGGLFELNESAAFVWRLHIAGERDDGIAAAMASRYELDYQTALEHARGVLAEPHGGVPPIQSDYRYERVANGYSFSFQGQRVFEIDDARAEMTTQRDDLTRRDLRYLVRAVAPKLLGLGGRTVLHASAVDVKGSIVAFCGTSGAGKTTTAHAFVDAGAALVAEDQVLVEVRGTRIMASVTSERATDAWVSDASNELGRSGRISFAALDEVALGEYRPLKEIGFLDQTRRTGYGAKSLEPIVTASATFQNAFFGSDTEERWIEQLEIATQVGRNVLGVELSLPNGLQMLATTARDLFAAGSVRASQPGRLKA